MSEEEYSEDEHTDEDDYTDEDEHTDQLSATMAMLSETYPTVVYYKKAVACGLPEHFMDLRFAPDKWGRVPCKREAMDWYLKNDVKYEKDLGAAERNLKDISETEIIDGKQVTVNVGKNESDNGVQAEMGPATSNSK